MPVTFQVAQHPANGYKIHVQQAHIPPHELLHAACPNQANQCAELLQSSIEETRLPRAFLVPRGNGFVHAVLEAYGGHHHLKMKPDDVWIAILVQLNYYVNSHAEDLRAYFVAHDGKKDLVVTYAGGNRYTVDYAGFARRMSAEIHENVVDKTLVEWVLPDFSTTTHKDTTICAVALMATLKAYFNYTFSIICGIPSVTLEGTRDDWARLLARLDRLPELGEEPAAWACMLRPILSRFVNAFDGEPDVPFWNQAVYRDDSLCGVDSLSGWITAFCVWSDKGKWQAAPPADILRAANGTAMARGHGYVLDGVPYFETDVGDLPAGFVEVPVTIDDNGQIFPSMMVAGHVALALTSSADPAGAGAKYDTLSPSAEWFMFVKKDYDEMEEAERELAALDDSESFGNY